MTDHLDEAEAGDGRPDPPPAEPPSYDTFEPGVFDGRDRDPEPKANGGTARSRALSGRRPWAQRLREAQ